MDREFIKMMEKNAVEGQLLWNKIETLTTALDQIKILNNNFRAPSVNVEIIVNEALAKIKEMK